MKHAKIKPDKQLQLAPNPLKITVANPSDELYEQFGWMEVVETNPPEYDHDTQYLTSYYEEENGKAVQKWEKHEKPEPEPTIEDRVDGLEDNVSDIINGVTE